MTVSPGLDLDVALGAFGPAIELDGGISGNRARQPERVVVSPFDDHRPSVEPNRGGIGGQPNGAQRGSVKRIRKRPGLDAGRFRQTRARGERGTAVDCLDPEIVKVEV